MVYAAGRWATGVLYWRIAMSWSRYLFGGAEINAVAANAGLLILRLFTGLAMAFAHGLHKIPPSQRFVESVGKLGFPIPELFAWAAGCAEFFGGLLLATGLMTRPASFFIAVTMFVAAFMRHAADPFTGKEKALLFGVVAVAFLLIGSGKYGIDALIRRRGSR